MITLEGLIYYWPQEDGTGDIAVVTFTRRPPEEVEGMQVAVFPANELADRITNGMDTSRCRITFSDDGSPEITQITTPIAQNQYEYQLRPLEPYENQQGFVLRFDDNINIESRTSQNVITYPFTATFVLYFTKLDDPAIVLDSWEVTLSDIFAGKAVYDGSIEGRMWEDFTIWVTTPGPETPIWWIKHD